MSDDLENFDDPPYSEDDAGNVLNVLWLALGCVAVSAVCFVMGWI